MKALYAIVLLLFSYNLNADCIEGNNSMVKDEIYLPDATELLFYIDANIFITQSNSQSIVVESSENIHKALNISYSGDEIIFEKREDICPRKLNIYIDVSKLSVLKIYSNASITSTNKLITGDLYIDFEGNVRANLELQSEDIELDSEGSGNISLRGSTIEFDAVVEGAGEMDALNLTSEHCDIDVEGAGIAKVNASKELNVILNGSGIIYYKGNPREMTKEIDGSGKIEQVK